ncbi:MAG: hypothetical protein A2172_04165 [Candidatus Woykebacteria bacterium RBG_13_40_15]|uniref:Secondary thiamine-phosphate synthase enzyme n=1 Tax=Candidatus Woykebacteria bacterium RBG_13_40_15 TaxID=1802593 RepID=A0A1G1W6U8_9BACT|nr:MAG: hypothetical protein A2172_04165 [Candidatus Woykebacteria bacterium RBG_13_40_15]
MNKIISLNTKTKREVINLTDKVNEIVKESKVKDGICLINILHTTAALIINEDEEGFKKDILKLFEQIIAKDGWEHPDTSDMCERRNATSHLAAVLIGSFQAVGIKEGKLNLGTWQNILFVELDGPRNNRQVAVKIVK